MASPITCRVLIVGGGLAGLQAAEIASQFVEGVMLLETRQIGSAPSSRRGAATVAAYLGQELGGLDSPYFSRFARNQGTAPLAPEPARQAYRSYLDALLAAGDGLSEPLLVDLTADGIYNRLGWLEAYGLHWARDEAGRYAALPAQGHAVPRVALLVEGPDAAMRVLREGAETRGADLREGLQVTRLFVEGGRVRGAYAIDVASGEGMAIEARTVILATGGTDGLYRDELNATTGDGYALALDAGAELANLEFSQFQPEPLFAGAALAAALGPILLAMGPESAAAEQLERLAHAAPYLAPTAASARNGVTWKTGYAGGLGGAVHHLFQTGVEGLFVAGEMATGAHGASALPGTLTSYTLCSAEEAAIRAAKLSCKLEPVPLTPGVVDAERTRLERATGGGPAALTVHTIEELVAEVRALMWEHVGPRRDAAGLATARQRLAAIDARCAASAASPRDLPALLRLRHLVRAGRAVAASAEARQETRGQHVRADYPARDDSRPPTWTSVVDREGQLVVGQRPAPSSLAPALA